MSKRSTRDKRKVNEKLIESEALDSQKNCQFFDYCDRRLGRAAFKGRIVALIHLTIRMVYTIVAWAVLAKSISSTTFFVSLFLFVVPILMDCVSYSFVTWSRKWIIKLEIFICVICFLFALFGLANIFEVILVDEVYFISTSKDFIGFQGSLISVQYIWRILAVIPFITVVDFACRYTFKGELSSAKRKGDEYRV